MPWALQKKTPKKKKVDSKDVKLKKKDAEIKELREECEKLRQEYLRQAADKDNLYGDIAKQAGVSVEAVVQRHVNRRTGRRSSAFFESVFIWRKP